MPKVDLLRQYLNDRETPFQFKAIRRDTRRAILRGPRRGATASNVTIIGQPKGRVVIRGALVNERGTIL